jgi:predicted ATPase
MVTSKKVVGKKGSTTLKKNVDATTPASKKQAKTALPAGGKQDEDKLLKLDSIEFRTPPFRKLGNIKVPISRRVTLIAGRNGVGKSTILALIAGTSGLARAGVKTYLGVEPRVNAEEILRLSFSRDFVKKEAERPYMLLTYSFGDKSFVKKGNVSGSKDRLRVVPRNEPKAPITMGGIKIPESGKVPIPTIYLGMTRVIPTGETDPDSLQQRKVSMAPEDHQLYHDFSEAVIFANSAVGQSAVTAQAISGTKKNALYPNYPDYEPTNVSLGQDSLSSIASALASFSKIRRDMGAAYRGGLLVIDELDAGFHPRAQVVLLEQLTSKARELQIQVVATTHSLTLLECAHRDIHNDSRVGTAPDQIVYLKGGFPVELLDVKDFGVIYADMHMHLLPVAPVNKSVKVYVEDDEAAIFLEAILTTARKNRIKEVTGFKLDVIPVRVGCSNLVGLLKADDYFKTVVIAIDADAEGVRTGNAANVVKLPKDPLNSKKQSPEVIINEMCKKITTISTAYPETKKLIRTRGADESFIQTYILARRQTESVNSPPIETDREVAKAWFNARLSNIKNMQLVDGWVADNEVGVEEFIQNLMRAVLAATTDPSTLAAQAAAKKTPRKPVTSKS